MTQTQDISRCADQRETGALSAQVVLSFRADAHTASRLLIPGRNGSVHLHDEALIIIEIDPVGSLVAVSLELASHRYALARYRDVRIERGPGHLDVFDAGDRRIIAISAPGHGGPHLVRTDIPTMLGLPGGTYELPRLSTRTQVAQSGKVISAPISSSAR